MLGFVLVCLARFLIGNHFIDSPKRAVQAAIFVGAQVPLFKLSKACEISNGCLKQPEILFMKRRSAFQGPGNRRFLTGSACPDRRARLAHFRWQWFSVVGKKLGSEEDFSHCKEQLVKRIGLEQRGINLQPGILVQLICWYRSRCQNDRNRHVGGTQL